MRYIEITIWHPWDCRRSMSWMPRFEWWTSGDGFDFDWLFINLNVHTKEYVEKESETE